MERPPALRSLTDLEPDVEIRELAAGELRAAALVLAEGMRDNPLHVKVFGANPDRRERRLFSFLGHLIGYVRSNGQVLGAYAQGELVGVLGMMKPGRCHPAGMSKWRFARAILTGNSPIGVLRTGRWLAAWKRNDPSEPHWHLGPMAVRPASRRRGIARRLMTRCCAHIDTLEATAFLETDLAINAAFYETLDFVVTRRERVLGVSTWFMRRAPRTGADV